MSKNIITIHRPVLTDEERARRMEGIRRAAAALLREAAEKEWEREQRKKREAGL